MSLDALQHVDPTDAGILHLLRSDARNTTTAEIADVLGLAPSTVDARLRKLESSGVVTGYEPRLDDDRLGFEHRFIVAGTAPFEQRRTVTDELTEVPSVVDVRSMMTTEINVAVKIVGSNGAGIERTLEQLQRRARSIDRIEILETERHRPTNLFDQFVTDTA